MKEGNWLSVTAAAVDARAALRGVLPAVSELTRLAGEGRIRVLAARIEIGVTGAANRLTRGLKGRTAVGAAERQNGGPHAD